MNEYWIVDGQQRITTFFILFKVLLDLYDEDDEIKNEIYNYIYAKADEKQDEEKKYRLKRIGYGEDLDPFALFMKRDRDCDHKHINDDKDDKIIKDFYSNYHWYKKKILELSQEKVNNVSLSKEDALRETIREILESLKKMVIARFSISENSSDSQRVFESINSTGVHLTLSDLIKNYLLIDEKNKVSKIYEQWKIIENNLKIDNSKNKDYLDNFFIHFLIYVDKSDVERNAYLNFKKWIKENNKSKSESMKTLIKFSEFYGVFTKGDSKDKYGKTIDYLLSGFRVIKQTSIYPFLLHVFNDFKNGKIKNIKTLEDVLSFFLNYTVRILISPTSTNVLSKFYYSLYNNIFPKDKNNERDYDKYFEKICEFMVRLTNNNSVPEDDEELKNRLSTMKLYNKGTLCKYLLSIIENRFRIKRSSETVKIDEFTTIEHIFPQNENSEEWKKETGNEFRTIHEDYLHTLGNLTLTNKNSALSDKPFSVKKKQLEDLEISKFSHLNKEIINKEKWNIENIEKRTKILIEDIFEQLELPKEYTQAKDDYDKNKENSSQSENKNNKRFTIPGESYETTDDQSENKTSKTSQKVTVKKFLFQNEEYKASGINNMYLEICKKIIDDKHKENPEVFKEKFKQAIKKGLFYKGAGNEKYTLRPSIVVDGEIKYVKNNMSLIEFKNAIKKLFELFGIDEKELKYSVTSLGSK